MRPFCAFLLMGTTTFSCQTGEFVTGPNPPHAAPVDGTWSAGTVTVTTSDQRATCAASNLTFELAQDGTSLAGNFWTSNVSCIGPGAPGSPGPMSGSIINGTLIGNTIAFQLGGSQFQFSGTMSGDTMAGGTTWQLWSPTGQTTLSGGWAAVRN